MAGPPLYPANSNLNSRPFPPSTSSHSTVAYTPSSVSVADSSDNDYDPTPLHSPGGPGYDDLPPSYDDAQHQAVHDSRNGIAPIDPNQIEAHRLTLNEGPDEPEVWEYRVRGEQVDPASEREQAPDYANHTNDKATSVPVQHVSISRQIPVGHVQSDSASSTVGLDAMLSQALEFVRYEPDANMQYARHLNRPIAIPDEGGPGRSADETAQFLSAYPHVLSSHSVKSSEFLDFLDGLNVLLKITNTSTNDLLHGPLRGNASSSILQDYLRGANEAYFAPRALRISVLTQSALLDMLPIPIQEGQRAAAIAGLKIKLRTAEWRARSLIPWIEALDADVPYPRTGTLRLREMGERLLSQTPRHDAPGYEDPPHSIPGPAEDSRRTNRQFGPEPPYPQGQQGGYWSPFGTPGHGPFGAPGNGPFGAPGNSPFGGPGRGYAGRRGGRGGEWRGDEWAEVGKELGKMGEQFGKRMGDWGVQFGKRANAWGLDVGKMASGSGTQRGGGAGPAYDQPPHDDLPPSYEPPVGQESGVSRGDRKVDAHGYPEDRKVDTSAPAYPAEKIKSKSKDKDYDDDDDTSSMSSDSSDSDSDSDSDDEEYPNTDAAFAARMRFIDEQATAASKKGKKSAEEVSRERASAISNAQNDKENMEIKIASKLSKRAARRELKQRGRELKQRGRELKREHRHRKRELRASHDKKGKGKTKKSREWRDAKKEYRVKRKELRKEKLAARKEWREARNDGRRTKKSEYEGSSEVTQENETVWLLIENLAP
jgi:hypothetical protein